MSRFLPLCLVFLSSFGIVLSASSCADGSPNDAGVVDFEDAGFVDFDAGPVSSKDAGEDAGEDAGATMDGGTTTFSYPILDTFQSSCYDVAGLEQACDDASGQDAAYATRSANFVNNDDGTVGELHSGMVWQRHHSEAMPYSDAADYCETLDLGGQSDWRLPSIKELYALIHFDGHTGIQNDEVNSWTPANWKLYIDGSYDVTDDEALFIQEYGNESTGSRILDCQVWSSSDPVANTMNNNDSVLGGNFCDGRIKSYPKNSAKFTKCVRGGEGYGVNDFVLSDEGKTVSDKSTGLMWTKAYSNATDTFPSVASISLGDGSMPWTDALEFCESLDFAGKTDWKLPDIKELQSIVAYAIGEPAIDTNFFDLDAIQAPDHCNGGTFTTFPYFWSSTTHVEYSVPQSSIRGDKAAYIAFGKAWGSMNQGETWIDAHGPGAQRSDPKSGDPADQRIRCGFGPQGDYIGIHNWVRCVRVVQP
ncbi:MAG: DUF1566 domain-containing protein [Deltaproteobacteria bacterium]|nr:DUF1566 domain-containing protein [Deltaproteobacteria bacterium]